MRNLAQDLKYALRTLTRSPVFLAVAVASLALGIGANTAIFSLVDQLLLRLLPVKNPRELVLLNSRGSFYGSNTGGNAMAYLMYRFIWSRLSAVSKVNRSLCFTISGCTVIPYMPGTGQKRESARSLQSAPIWCRTRPAARRSASVRTAGAG